MTDLSDVFNAARQQFDRDVELKRKRSLARHELLQEVGVLLAKLAQCSQQEFTGIYVDQVDEVLAKVRAALREGGETLSVSDMLVGVDRKLDLVLAALQCVVSMASPFPSSGRGAKK